MGLGHNCGVKTLDDDQLQAFDTEYVTDALWAAFSARVAEDFPEGDFRFIDLGGGTGRFADRVLEAFPKSTGIVLDNGKLLLDRNAPHPRKELVLAGVEAAPLAEKGPFDLVCFNWVLHHLVDDGYSATRRAVDGALGAACRALTPRGRISIFENLYDGVWIDALPGRLIYEVTSSKLLAPLARSQGANTAGVGVCFRSREGWLQVLREGGLEVRATADDAPWALPLKWRVLLHMGNVRCGHFWTACGGRADFGTH